jgi:hypothetical protein
MPTQVVDLGFTPRPWQAQVFLSLLRFAILVVHRRGGKTLLAIMKLIDAALCCTRERGQYAYIAPQLKQAKGLSWDYLKSYSLKIPGTEVNESELWVRFPNGARIRLFGADNPDSLRGYYFDGAVVDEVAQMKRELWGEILIPALSDRQGWVLFIGTPKGMNLFSELYFAALANEAEWFHGCYTHLDTKALPDSEVEKMRREMTPNQFRQEMMCDFGASSDDNLIPQELAREAVSRKVTFQQIEHAPKILGVDVAWDGGDRCVIFKRQGLATFEPVVRQGIPEKSFSAVVTGIIDVWQPDAVFVDITGGYGGEVLSRIRDSGFSAIGVKFSEGAYEDDKFLNLRAEMWFKMMTWLKDGGALPNDPGLIQELCAPTYDNNNAAAKLQLEAKKKIKERLGFSPDKADALALTFAQPVRSKAELTASSKRYRGERPGDFDPLSDSRVRPQPTGDFDPYRTF